MHTVTSQQPSTLRLQRYAMQVQIKDIQNAHTKVHSTSTNLKV